MIKRQDRSSINDVLWYMELLRSQEKISIRAVDKNFTGRYKDEDSSS